MQVSESSTNIIAEGTRIEGTTTFDNVTRVHGTLVGEVRGKPGSTIVLAESSVTEGTVHGDTILVDGFVRGDISAEKKLTISGTGRVIGNIRAPSVVIEFGAHFEGRSIMEASDSSR